MKRFIRAITALSLVTTLSPLAAAQKPGDLVFWHNDGRDRLVLAAPADQLATTTQLWDSGGAGVWALTMDHGNGGVLAVSHPRSLLRITGVNATSLVEALPQPTVPRRSVARDQDGSILMTHYTGTPNEASVLRVDHTTNLVSTVFTLTRTLFEALCRDDGTGHFLLINDVSNLLSIDRSNGTVTTVAQLDRTALHRAMCYIPGRDMFAVSIGSRSSAPGQLGFMTRGGVVQSRVNLTTSEGQAYCITFDESRNLIHVGTDTGSIVTFRPDGTRVRSHNYGGGLITCIDVWGDRPLSLRTTGRPGDNLEITLGFLRSGNRPYAVAFSLGLGTATQIGNQNLFATLDRLFFVTVSQLPGFGGTLAADGSKTINFRIPSTLPSGFKVYVTAFAQNPTIPGGFDLGNTECLLID